jgi:predicted kinase
MENDTENLEPKKAVKKDEKKKSEKQTKAEKDFVKNTVELNPELTEQAEKTVVLGWGRMNPITTGHEKLVNKIKSVAKQNNATPVVYLTHSQDPKKNPLTYDNKIMLAKKAFGPLVQKTNAKTIMQVLAELDDKFDKVILVVGSDRVNEFSSLIKKYNGKDYEFQSVDVISAGDRDPDADDVSGMSASKMRALAAAGKPDEFKKGLPRRLQGMSAKVYDMVRSGMKLAEELEAEGLLTEAPLTLAQRRKRARIMKRYAPKIAAARKRMSRRKANMETLKRRARKKAISIIRKKVAGARGKSYAEMTPGEKIMIDKKVAKRQAAIERIAKKLVPQVRKAEAERLSGRKSVNEAFETLFEKPRNPEDPDIGHMKGSQPKGYYKGVKKSVKDDRARHFKKYGKMDDNNPKAYKPAPGDANAKTKESEYTKKYRQMYGEQVNVINDDKPKKKSFHQMLRSNGSPKLDKRFKINRKDYQSDQTEAVDPRVARLKDQHRAEKNRLRASHENEMDRLKTTVLRSKVGRRNKPIEEDVDILKLVDEIHESIKLEEAKQLEGLKKKAEKSGISYGILKKVFDRGVAAWRTGHRPGTTPSQWGYARVNSFITGGKTRTTADADLAKKINEDFENFMEDKASVQHHLGIGLTAKHMKQHALMHIDKDVDGDVDKFDKNTPDEITGAEKTNMTAKMLKKYAGEKEHSKKHIAFESVLEEGINDPSIFKAVFLAGGPGSGKSFIVGKTALPALGFKVINSDQAFEAALAKAGMAATPENIYSPKGQEIRTGAKALTKKKLDLAIAGRLGLVIDGTGKDYDKIAKQAMGLRRLGYDVAMIFVNTDEETALERNRKRSRSLPDDTVSKMWKDVQKNLGSFQTFFGNFFLVDNSEGSDFNSQSTNVYKKLATWAKKTPKNKVVTDWMKSQTQKEEHGAGFRGTSDLADKYAKDTPGQEPMKTHKNKYKEPKAKSYNEAFENLFKGTEE